MSEFLLAAEQLLRSELRPMSARQLTDLALERGLLPDSFHGATPWQTMKSKLSTEIRRNGAESLFIRTAPGRFYLRELMSSATRVYEAKPWRPPPSHERVMVFPTRALEAAGRFQGITTSWKMLNRRLLAGDTCQPLDRRIAESVDDRKQVLTYIVVTRKGQVLAYRRGSYNRVEQMLRGAECVGFGGHLRDSDRSLFSADSLGLFEGAARELSEELRLPAADASRLASGDGLEIVGFLNDDSSDVGRRHFAVLMRYEVVESSAWNTPTRGEESITRLRWIDPASPSLHLETYEYWSQLALRTLFPRQIRAQATYTVRSRARMRPPHLLTLVGQIGSGKTEAAAVLTERYGYVQVNTGRVVAELLGLPPVPETPRGVFQDAAQKFISQSAGPKRLARAILAASATLETDRILIDGVRQRATLEMLREFARPRRIATVYVHAPPDIAYRFYVEREHPGLDILGFLRLRESPVEREVSSLIDASDAVLYNWMGVKNYRNAIAALMSDIGQSEPSP